MAHLDEFERAIVDACSAIAVRGCPMTLANVMHEMVTRGASAHLLGELPNRLRWLEREGQLPEAPPAAQVAT